MHKSPRPTKRNQFLEWATFAITCATLVLEFIGVILAIVTLIIGN